jgi:hypothetical protein
LTPLPKSALTACALPLNSTYSLQGVVYDGHRIETKQKDHLLQKDEYESVSDSMKPYFMKLLGDAT